MAVIMKNRRGFTLIELLVVISVISIIIGVVIPRFKGMQDEANKTKAKAELKTLQTAIESWFVNQTPNAYPDDTSTICAAYLNTATPLIVSAPLYDPFRETGTEYSYAISPNAAYYVVFSYGPDREAGITGIDDDGKLIGTDNDVFSTNGSGTFQ
jgi:general secretion pathway protein G